MKKTFSIDRIEGELAVCISDDGEKVVVDVKELGGMAVRDIFHAELSGGVLANITADTEERDLRLARNHARLHAFARRNKK